ncbi:hypothetical protein HMPREF9013_1073 [Bulleidia extructa W1219]|uniref:Uncharacterized protein n=1 Tax=Bulleidia extructa W1219 TaxID=679192 RepID=D2MMT8_9FIRM|nr:hypothetical protein HMPREF9013_1073 [Bulleidia extructa W1219]
MDFLFYLSSFHTLIENYFHYKRESSDFKPFIKKNVFPHSLFFD